MCLNGLKGLVLKLLYVVVIALFVTGCVTGTALMLMRGDSPYIIAVFVLVVFLVLAAIGEEVCDNVLE